MQAEPEVEISWILFEIALCISIQYELQVLALQAWKEALLDSWKHSKTNRKLGSLRLLFVLEWGYFFGGPRGHNDATTAWV